MKITKEKLREIIKEELSELMAEQELEEEVLEEDELEENESEKGSKVSPKTDDDRIDRRTADLGDKPIPGKKPSSKGPKGKITGRDYRAEYEKDPNGYLGHS